MPAFWGMSDSNERLRQAREKAGIPSARAAALRFGWTPSTYASHENGQTTVPPKAAERYAKAYGVPIEWLLLGTGAPRVPNRVTRKSVPIVGFVGAGAEAHYVAAGELGRVNAPDGASDSTVAVEVRGDSLGAFFNGWLVFYDQVQRPITSDLIGKPCVVGLADGRVLVKKPQRSKTRGLFHLLSNTEPPILDVAIEWAAPISHMAPR